MDISIKWITDENYIQAYWKDFINCRSKSRKWTLHLAVTLIVLGFVYLIFGPNFNSPLPIAVALLCTGMLISIWHYWDKRKWFNLMRKSKSFGKENSLRFTVDNILFSGPTSKGEITWEGIEGIESAQNGTFIVLQKGLSIYLPRISNNQTNNLNEIIKFYDQINI